MNTPDIFILDEAVSTQEEARGLLIAGRRPPVWVAARRQTGGRGRRGREWFSAEGNLHVSVLLREDAPPPRLPELSFVAALALHKALSKVAMSAGRRDIAEALELKWPNDLLLFDRKLAGILLESEPAGEGAAAVIIGWGVNLAQAPREARWPAVSLAEEGLSVSFERMLGALTDSFTRWRDLWRAKGFPPVREAWMKRAWRPGERIALDDGGRRIEGVFHGLAEDGALLLRDDGGRIRAFHAAGAGVMRPQSEGD